MAKAPSLLSFCTKVVGDEISNANWRLAAVLSDTDEFKFIFCDIVKERTACSLDQFHCELLAAHDSEEKDEKKEPLYDRMLKDSSRTDLFDNVLKELDSSWKNLFEARWPNYLEFITDNWRWIYWETHLQSLLDFTCVHGFSELYNKEIGELLVGDVVMDAIGMQKTGENSTLSYHFQRFGHFARSLTIDGILLYLCRSEEMLELLSKSPLMELVIQGMQEDEIDDKKFPESISRAFKLVKQNKKTLMSLKFKYCDLTPIVIESVNLLASENPGIRHFTAEYSCFNCEENLDLRPFGSMNSLVISENRLGLSGNLVPVLLNASPNLILLDLSNNSLGGMRLVLTDEGGFSSLRVVNLRGNNLRSEDLDRFGEVLRLMPSLKVLDLSDNPIGDSGVSKLIIYLETVLNLCDLKIENCSFSDVGLAEFLRYLSSSDRWSSVSIADNRLGRWSQEVAMQLAEFLGNSTIKSLNIKDIELGRTGLLALREQLPLGLKLSSINISNNMGEIETTELIERFIQCAPGLVAIDASYNCIPTESVDNLRLSLKASGRKFNLLQNHLHHLEIRFL